MDALITATLAGLIGWLSILLVIHAPGSRWDLPGLRRVGAVAIALLGLQVLGLPIPAWLPLTVLLGGGAIVWLRPRGRAAA